jgi:hypothetical protein
LCPANAREPPIYVPIAPAPKVRMFKEEEEEEGCIVKKMKD